MPEPPQVKPKSGTVVRSWSRSRRSSGSLGALGSAALPPLLPSAKALATLPVKAASAQQTSRQRRSSSCALDAHLPGPLQALIPGRSAATSRLPLGGLAQPTPTAKTERVLPASRTSSSALAVSQEITGNERPGGKAVRLKVENRPTAAAPIHLKTTTSPQGLATPDGSAPSNPDFLAHMGLAENQLLLLQLPTHLPLARLPGSTESTPLFPDLPQGDAAQHQHSEESKSVKTTKLSASISSVSTSRPSGYFGKLLIRRSGALQILVGNAVFQVQSCAPDCFPQEVLLIDDKKRLALSLGPIKSKKVCRLDLDATLP
eukprot:gb/GEZN01010116.1/.p1 GENE.gb/GEZN01010116.1/~~gb/GEZN01010116.1/.p1  ORF type:complete len:317 (+),score=48.69 gb/GEZN01010116.1/:61-1011(+)